ncbi:hypothetical protein TNCV_1834561 [Trichonephila clavipes]|nr:hypothetical protein TNCV_1834561 [Trichonephila clavipes]
MWPACMRYHHIGCESGKTVKDTSEKEREGKRIDEDASRTNKRHSKAYPRWKLGGALSLRRTPGCSIIVYWYRHRRESGVVTPGRSTALLLPKQYGT